MIINLILDQCMLLLIRKKIFRVRVLNALLSNNVKIAFGTLKNIYFVQMSMLFFKTADISIN